MKRLVVIAIAILMCIPVLMLQTAAADDGDAAPADSRQGVNLIDLNAWSYNTVHYPWDTENFYFYVVTQYDGSYYNGVMGPPWNYRYLFDANMTFQNLVDDNYDPVAGTVIEWVRSDVDDNGGNGFDWGSPGWGYFIYDINGQQFEFRVRGESLRQGQYYIPVETTADVIVDWDGFNNTYATHTDLDYIPLEIRSAVNIGSFSGIDDFGSTENIYAGAVNERIGLQIWAASGSITQVQGELTVPDARIQVLEPIALCSNTNGNYDLLWFINVAQSTPTGTYRAEITLTYLRNGEQVDEVIPLTQDITVQWTPLLEFPDHNDYQSVLHTFVQNTPEGTFTVPIKNTGNMDLEAVTVRIDLDRASYFKNGDFFYYEGNYAQIIYRDLTFELGDINRGSTKDATFSDVFIKDNLPPGLYKIPLDYIGQYYDNGTLGSSDIVKTGYWDEKGHYDYQTIHVAADDPQPTSPFYPFVLVEVVDDDIGIDMYGQVSNVYTPGQTNRYISMQVFNKERYTFSSAYYTVYTDGGSPLKNVAAPQADTSPLPKVYAGNLPGAGSDWVYFYADIRQGLEPGLHHFMVEIEAYNPQQQLIKHTFESTMLISALTPSIQSMGVDVNMTAGGIGEVTVTLKNVGFGGAHNLTLYFESTNNNMKGIDGPTKVGNLLPGQSVDYTFRVQATRDTTSLYGTYSGNIYFEYTDDGGLVRNLYSAGSESVTYIFQPKLPDLKVINVDAPGIKAGKKFTVTLTVANIGGSTAFGTVGMYVSSNAYFIYQATGNGSTFNLGDMDAEETQTITMEFKASEALDDGVSYTLYIYFSYQRVNGYGLTFSEGEHEPFTVRTIDKIDVNREEQVVEYKNAGQLVDWGMVILGIFIFLSVVVGVTIWNKKQEPRDPYTAEVGRPAPKADEGAPPAPSPRTTEPTPLATAEPPKAEAEPVRQKPLPPPPPPKKAQFGPPRP